MSWLLENLLNILIASLMFIGATSLAVTFIHALLPDTFEVLRNAVINFQNKITSYRETRSYLPEAKLVDSKSLDKRPTKD